MYALFLASLGFCVHYCIDRDAVQKKKSCLVGKLVFFEGWEPQEARKTHNLLHVLITLTSMVLPASLNMQLVDLRKQQHLRGSCFASKFVFFEGWEPQEARKTRSRAQSAAHSHAIDLYGPACKSKYAAWSPA